MDERKALARGFLPRHAGPLSPDSERGEEGIKGFTLIEILISIAILGTIAAIAVPSYYSYLENARVAEAIAEIHTLQMNIGNYYLASRQLPDTLSEVPQGDILDPWGNLYQYLKIPAQGVAGVRKDGFLVPLNSDFDLYSKGKDGDSKPPLSAPVSWDDVIRANDGSYIGLASEY